MDIDIDHLRQWIGRQEVVEDFLTASTVARFNATFDRKSSLALAAAAPLMIHLCLCLPAVPTAELGPDGHPARGGFLPPVPLPRRMWAGGKLSFHNDILIGDTVERRSTVDDVVLKQGRSGPLCFVTVTHQIYSNGKHALTERHDIVYRAAEATPPAGKTAAQPVAKPAAPPAALGADRKIIQASAPLLFRYSALTFNGHRIHYDRPYAQAEESYPGLVIHGPMQASLLCQYAADLKGQPPKTFDFRSLSPIFTPDDFALNATADGEAIKLWTAQAAGPVSMQATAAW